MLRADTGNVPGKRRIVGRANLLGGKRAGLRRQGRRGNSRVIAQSDLLRFRRETWRLGSAPTRAHAAAHTNATSNARNSVKGTPKLSSRRSDGRLKDDGILRLRSVRRSRDREEAARKRLDVLLRINELDAQRHVLGCVRFRPRRCACGDGSRSQPPGATRLRQRHLA